VRHGSDLTWRVHQASCDIGDNKVMNAQTLSRVQMPNLDDFIPCARE